MTRRHLAEVGLKLLGVYALLRCLPLLPNAFLLAGAWDGDEVRGRGLTDYRYTIVLLLLACSGAAMLIFGRVLSRLLFRSLDDSEVNSTVPCEPLRATAFAVAGVVVAICTVPTAGWFFQSLWILASPASKYGDSTIAQRTAVQFGVLCILQLGLAAGLLVRARALMTRWRREQTEAAPITEPASPDERA
jgi:hypothetical protein